MEHEVRDTPLQSPQANIEPGRLRPVLHIRGAKDQTNLEIRCASGVKAIAWKRYSLRLNAIAVAGPKAFSLFQGLLPAAFSSHCRLQNTFSNEYEEMEMS